jgi:hypothetical protein
MMKVRQYGANRGTARAVWIDNQDLTLVDRCALNALFLPVRT